MNPLARPQTYGDCQRIGLGSEARSCPHVWCAEHTGNALASCTLRVAEWGGASYVEVASILGISRERVWQIERRALAMLALDEPVRRGPGRRPAAERRAA